jgi:hypothetical protein
MRLVVFEQYGLHGMSGVPEQTHPEEAMRCATTR